MIQEIQIKLILTLGASVEKSKQEIAHETEAIFNTLFLSLSKPLSNYLSKYKGGNLLLDATKIQILDIKEEGEIYNHDCVIENLSMSNYMHFCFNYPHNFLDVAFAGHQHLNHIKSKFNSCYNREGSKAVIPCFFSELDSENQKLLSNYVASLYQ